MSRSIRYVIRGVNGRVRCSFTWPGVIDNISVVQVSVGEVRFGGTRREPTNPGQNFYYVLGDADIWVSNISPRLNTFRAGDLGGVLFTLHVDWPSPLDIGVTVTVEDQPPIEIQGF